ncbi:hypothetical protein CE91St56_37080 [Lachnospiraceae bacterium]|nr:hypothetical protein CE91St56_37080 [Lachnospiraceae bacterium]GKH42657.1 hypothetical protein CE91St57_36310 [Lachnospiraceae bacterium]
MSASSDTLDAFGLIGMPSLMDWRISFSVPGTPLCQRAEGHFVPAKFELVMLQLAIQKGYGS